MIGKNVILNDNSPLFAQNYTSDVVRLSKGDWIKLLKCAKNYQIL